MVLSDRKVKILEAIINDYIQVAEPVGSRTIAKKYDLGLSSATIRNEMSDLEELGLIMQPHASSGRVPSDKGYRLYVDQLANYRELTAEEIFFLREVVSDNISQIDYLMKETARAISLLTSYTTIITEPQIKKTKIKHVQLVPLDESSIVMLLVTDGKAVRNSVVNIENPPNYEMLGNISVMLNNCLQGRTLEHIHRGIVEELLGKLQVDEKVLLPILNAVVAVIKAEDTRQFYTSGVKNILAFPEFSDVEKAKGIFHALEEKEMLITLLDSDGSENVQVVIGAENSLEQLQNCSIIKTNYRIGENYCGSIGIIGPTRMDYAQVVSVLNGIAKNVNAVLKALTGG